MLARIGRQEGSRLASSVGGARPAAGEGGETPASGQGGAEPPAGSGQTLGFVVATVGYLAVTTAESLLAPVVPVVRDELGIDIGTAGLAFALLTLAIAGGNLAGGLLLARRGARQGVVAGLAVTTAGTLATAASGGRLAFLLSQVLVGLGSGVFFASGLYSVGVLAGTRRRGFAMGLFGVAFSGGLAGAALLAALADVHGWRLSYGLVAALAAAAGIACALARLPSTPAGGGLPGLRTALRRLLRRPLLVAGVGAISQYGTVGFLPTFAVLAWGMSPASAALALTAARLLSVPAKLVSGNATDQAGSLRIARRLGIALVALGLWWTLAPGPAWTLWAAVVFAALVSGLGPVANVLALDSFGGEGMLLGAFRSAQIAVGSAASAAIGGASSLLGLRPVLVVCALVPLAMVPAGFRLREWRRARAGGGAAS
jgi:predicted MFS family arabinose efflux permease